MRKLFVVNLVICMLVSSPCFSGIKKDIFFIDRMIIGYPKINHKLNSGIPENSTWSFYLSKRPIRYYANLMVINPVKNQYYIELECVDSKGLILSKSTFRKNVSANLKYNMKDVVYKNLSINVSVSTKKESEASGIACPISSGGTYYIKLYVEKKLIGMTEFDYHLL